MSADEFLEIEYDAPELSTQAEVTRRLKCFPVDALTEEWAYRCDPVCVHPHVVGSVDRARAVARTTPVGGMVRRWVGPWVAATPPEVES